MSATALTKAVPTHVAVLPHDMRTAWDHAAPEPAIGCNANLAVPHASAAETHALEEVASAHLL